MATITDMFCGAGGSTLGAVRAGAVATYGLNHWTLAVESHWSNFPEADHDCADISATDPRRYRRTDILLASPECTNHSVANGNRKVTAEPNLLDEGGLPDEAQERSRATMWDVVRFAEVHEYRAIVVENVVDAFWWGRKTPQRKMGDGGLFAAWLASMDALGYEHEIVWMNSMFAPPTPQSRDRMYVVFWQKAMRRPNLRFDVPAWCPHCEQRVEGRQSWKKPGPQVWGRYAEQYVYSCPTCHKTAIPGAVPAATAIDWSRQGDVIGDRQDPLAVNTRERIRRGMERVTNEPFADRLTVKRGRPRTLPLVDMLGGDGVVVPMSGNLHERTPGNRSVRASAQSMPVVHTTSSHALVVPPAGTGHARDVSDALMTQTTTTRGALVVANRTNATGSEAELDPMRVVCAGGEHHALVTVERSGGLGAGPLEPTHTVAGSNHLGVVVANYGGNGNGWARDAHSDVFGSMTTRDGHALVVPYYSTGVAHSVGDPLGAATTRDRYGLVVPDSSVRVVDPVTWTDDMIDACRFRMFGTDEIARAMQMHVHVTGEPYIVLGNRTEQMKQLGNAVTPPVMEQIVGRLLEILG